MGANGIEYGANALASRNYLINTKGWTISGDSPTGIACGSFFRLLSLPGIP
ncbi:MAG: hypothetical protein R2784_13420 [Saprospiraceae bacterium]